MHDRTQAIRAARLFEFYVRTLWPLHRLFVRGRIARRCQRCAASERMIPLGDDGRCQICASADQAPAPDRASPDEARALHALLDAHAGRGRGLHDALVLFSGGKDSAYLIRRVQTEHPRLRLLACTVDNGFMSPVARDNVERLVALLDVDHVLLRPRKEIYVKLFRHGLTHLGPQGGYGTVDFSDGELLLDSARRLAAEQDIPLILCGYSRYQVQDGLGLHALESPRARELADRTHVAGMALADIFEADEIGRWWHGSQWPPERVARLLFPLYAWDLQEDEILRQARAWGLLGARQQSPIVTNHRLIPLLGVVDVHQLGYSSFEIELCRMIREGKADRAHWQRVFELLEHCARSGLFVERAVVESLAELGLALDDVRVRFG